METRLIAHGSRVGAKLFQKGTSGDQTGNGAHCISVGVRRFGLRNCCISATIRAARATVAGTPYRINPGDELEIMFGATNACSGTSWFCRTGPSRSRLWGKSMLRAGYRAKSNG